MPVTQMSGAHLWMPQLVSMLRFETVDDYEHYLARLHAIPNVLRADDRAHEARAPTKHLDAAEDPARAVRAAGARPRAAASPPTSRSRSRSRSSRRRSRRPIKIGCAPRSSRRSRTRSSPPTRSSRRTSRRTTSPQGRTEPGEWSLPDGDARYAADVKRLDDDRPHARRRSTRSASTRSARIESEEAALATKLGFKTPRRAAQARPRRQDAVREEPRRHPRRATRSTPRRCTRSCRRCSAACPKQQHRRSRQTESFREKTASGAEYQQGTPDGSRTGTVRVNTSDPTKRLTLDIESTAYHEGVPGHHLQIAIQQELGDLPPFRQHGNYTAYAEGWALYAERLGEEVGFYRIRGACTATSRTRCSARSGSSSTPASTTSTGRATRSSRSSTTTRRSTRSRCRAETDRYIAWPAQALGYKIGQLTILRLRSEAQDALGAKFDIRAFHDEILGAGALPMDVLERRIHAWIERTRVPR